MLVGYMRVSSDSDRQSTDLQRDALLAAGVDARHLFEDRASGVKDDRSGLAQTLEFVRPGDVLVVWKLDRLGRSLSHLLAIVNTLKDRQVAFRSLTEGMDTTTDVPVAAANQCSVATLQLLSLSGIGSRFRTQAVWLFSFHRNLGSIVAVGSARLESPCLRAR